MGVCCLLDSGIGITAATPCHPERSRKISLSYCTRPGKNPYQLEGLLPTGGDPSTTVGMTTCLVGWQPVWWDENLFGCGDNAPGRDGSVFGSNDAPHPVILSEAEGSPCRMHLPRKEPLPIGGPAADWRRSLHYGRDDSLFGRDDSLFGGMTVCLVG